MRWHPLETDLRSARDQLVQYRPDFQHVILSSAGGRERMEESADRESLQITMPHGGTRTSVMCWSALRMAISSAMNMDTGGREDFLRLWKSGMAKAAPTELSSSTDPSVKYCRNCEY